MTTTETPTNDPLKTLWAIREKIYEETKDMTDEEEREYSRKKVEAFQKAIDEANPDDHNYDFSFLRYPSKQGKK